jgi:hypothetical protein
MHWRWHEVENEAPGDGIVTLTTAQADCGLAVPVQKSGSSM